MGHVSINVPWSLYGSINRGDKAMIFLVGKLFGKEDPLVWSKPFEYRVVICIATLSRSIHHVEEVWSWKGGKFSMSKPLSLNYFMTYECHDPSLCFVVAISSDASIALCCNFFRLHDLDSIDEIHSLFWMLSIRLRWSCVGGGFAIYHVRWDRHNGWASCVQAYKCDAFNPYGYTINEGKSDNGVE